MDLRKCQLIQDKLSFLGYVIFAEGRTLDDSGVAAIEKFEPHRNAKKLYSFLQFANHYRKFIPKFAKLTHKLRHLLAKDVLIVWTDAHQAIVNAVKHYRAEIKRVPHAAGKINQKNRQRGAASET
ncbi:hypothetical protein HPB52_008171 [Rhipicephalus sanguineus]|uniref:Reverse transcriptase/retrotransposon-derived protein RNase H-like domain-containing protein n=1 Tax=Rhipicephalus sanguineus TaxID=34632 RepID=A0A9D4Q1E4_RHISA|nr:hypothetical protein HPB52_008171 [Rhipicephalus sanguineus]